MHSLGPGFLQEHLRSWVRELQARDPVPTNLLSLLRTAEVREFYGLLGVNLPPIPERPMKGRR